MMELKPINQQKLFGLDEYFLEIVRLYNEKRCPNKILLSGQKGIGKSTMAFHFINFVLSQNETNKYDLKNFKINSDSKTYKLILNNSNTNLSVIDVEKDKKSIDIDQIRELINNLNKSSFNNQPRFVLIDNIEFLNKNSINALLKNLEEPNDNIFFILINNNRKILPTLLSRCINFKIHLSNRNKLEIAKNLLGDDIENLINKDIIDYYFTPGIVFNLMKFATNYKYDLLNLNLDTFLHNLIKENHYKKDPFMNHMIFNLVEIYFRKLNSNFSLKINNKYSYFLKRISDTKTFNLDMESLFMEFEENILNG